MGKVLVFGGAFDPPHCEHVAACKAAMRQLDIDTLVVVPTFQPRHKDGAYLDFEQRASLADIAFKDMNAIVDSIEYERGGENYSALVLPLLKKKYGDIVYLVGGDSIEHLDSWFKPEDAVKACTFAVVGREGYGRAQDTLKEVEKRYGGDFVLINYTGKNVSSSALKVKLLTGQTPAEISAEVMEEIRRRRLFEEYLPTMAKLKEFESGDLFAHSIAVALTAAELNSTHCLKQNFKKTFLAAILHDNAKQRPSLDGLPVPQDSVGTPVLHQFLGALKAERDFGVTDHDVLDAIRCHTTAKAAMTTFEKLIYTADSLSFDRDYDPIPALRKIAFEDFEKGFLATLDSTYKKLEAKGGKIYPLTVQAYEYYFASRKDGSESSAAKNLKI